MVSESVGLREQFPAHVTPELLDLLVDRLDVDVEAAFATELLLAHSAENGSIFTADAQTRRSCYTN